MWLEAEYPRFTFDFNGFVRWMDDYITLAPTALPKRLPLSPDVVFRYINGSARFTGFEAAIAVKLADDVTGSVATEYLWGEDEELDEPALGVTPWTTGFQLRYDQPSDRFYLEAGLEIAAEQDRVAATRGELVTDGFVTADLRAGVTLTRGVQLRAGALNLFDEEYVNHLNAKNPFTGLPIPEPGRVLFADVSFAF